MQSSSMKIPSTVCSADAAEVAGVHRETGCFAGKADFQLEASSDANQKTNRFPITAMILVVVSCVACTLGLLVGAFTAVPDTDVSTPCGTSVTSAGSDSAQTFVIFVMGYLFCLVVKHRDDLAGQAFKMLHFLKAAVSTICLTATSSVSALASGVAWVRSRTLGFRCPSWINKGAIAIMMVVLLCTICIIWLFASAFNAEPDTDPTDDGLTSESSSGMRAFTVGWMFILSFKLRRELVGQVGPCCLLQPW